MTLNIFRIIADEEIWEFNKFWPEAEGTVPTIFVGRIMPLPVIPEEEDEDPVPSFEVIGEPLENTPWATTAECLTTILHFNDITRLEILAPDDDVRTELPKLKELDADQSIHRLVCADDSWTVGERWCQVADDTDPNFEMVPCVIEHIIQCPFEQFFEPVYQIIGRPLPGTEWETNKTAIFAFIPERVVDRVERRWKAEALSKHLEDVKQAFLIQKEMIEQAQREQAAANPNGAPAASSAANAGTGA